MSQDETVEIQDEDFCRVLNAIRPKSSRYSWDTTKISCELLRALRDHLLNSGEADRLLNRAETTEAVGIIDAALAPNKEET